MMTEILARYRRMVLWGFTDSQDSFRHIHRHFAHALSRLGKEWAWLPNDPASLDLLSSGDLVFAVNVEGNHIRALPGIDYVLHNFDSGHLVWEKMGQKQFLRLQTYTRDAERYSVGWSTARRFDAASRTLFQPWGTDLLSDEFLDPVFNGDSRHVAFVGSIWDGEGQGNVRAIHKLHTAVVSHGLIFDHLFHVDDAENIAAVRSSRIAPAVAGEWQVSKSYLPCRLFKNVSYGALGITNVHKFRDILGDAFFDGTNIAETVMNALALSEADYLALVREQQQAISQYTYKESLLAIERALEEGR
jgi:hypothetical protein